MTTADWNPEIPPLLNLPQATYSYDVITLEAIKAAEMVVRASMALTKLMLKKEAGADFSDELRAAVNDAYSYLQHVWATLKRSHD